MITYTKNNTVHVDPEIAEGQSLLYLGTPCHTICPYETYARMIAEQARKAFMRSKLTAVIHCCHRRLASVGHGSGRGGAVRFGDDMLPPDVQAVVATEDLERAAAVWEDWQARRGFRRPVTVVGDLWYELGEVDPNYVKFEIRKGVWRRGGTWPHVVANAVALANFLGRPTDRLAKYVMRRQITTQSR